MSRTGKVLYTGRTRTVGGRHNGISRSIDGHLDIRLSTPGSPRIGTNPEQLLAAGWSASFASAIACVASRRKVALPTDITIDTEVDLSISNDNYLIVVRLDVDLPGVERNVARALIDEAQTICPYSNATRGNIDVAINLI